jgi:hypothetical protein
VIAILMLKLKHDFLVVPKQYTIPLCESLVLACGTLIGALLHIIFIEKNIG